MYVRNSGDMYSLTAAPPQSRAVPRRKSSRISSSLYSAIHCSPGLGWARRKNLRALTWLLVKEGWIVCVYIYIEPEGFNLATYQKGLDDIFVYIYIYVYIIKYMYIHVYIHMHIHTDDHL